MSYKLRKPNKKELDDLRQYLRGDDKIARVELDDGFLYRKKRYLKNLTDEELAEEFDNTLDKFREQHNIDYNKIEELVIGWLDYKYSEMGELEKEIKNAIKRIVEKTIKKMEIKR